MEPSDEHCRQPIFSDGCAHKYFGIKGTFALGRSIDLLSPLHPHERPQSTGNIGGMGDFD